MQEAAPRKRIDIVAETAALEARMAAVLAEATIQEANYSSRIEELHAAIDALAAKLIEAINSQVDSPFLQVLIAYECSWHKR